MPYVIKGLAILGTIALLLVSGGIFNHNIEFLHHFLPDLNSTIKDFSIGILVGLIVVGIVHLFKPIFKTKKQN